MRNESVVELKMEPFGGFIGRSVDRETFEIVKMYIQDGRDKMEIIRELRDGGFSLGHAISIWQNASWEA